jgi:hypothetical protein
MGLVIYHHQAVLERPATTDPYEWAGITEEAYDDFNVPIDHFGKYIQQIDRPRIVQTVMIVEEKNYFEEKKALFSNTDYIVLFKDSEASLEKQLSLLESKYHLSNLHRGVSTTPPPRWQLLYYFEKIKVTGFYVHCVGCQSKGMNNAFNERFTRGDFINFARREDFQFAYQCIDFSRNYYRQEDVEARQLNFKRTFLDNYAFGASYMSVSY